MSAQHNADWDPRSALVLDDQIAAYDTLRRRCPVAHSDYLHWSLLRHADVMRALIDHATFSNVVSSHLSVPNGMDPPVHTAYRRLIEPYFDPARMQAFEPHCRRIAAGLCARLSARGEIELMGEFAGEFAVQFQCAFLGWPPDLHEPLRAWVRKNHAATLARDTAAMAEVANEFDGHVRVLLGARRAAGAAAPDDLTTSLLREQVGDRPLNDEEIVSILRNCATGRWASSARSRRASGSWRTTWPGTRGCSGSCASSRRNCRRRSTKYCASARRSSPTAASPRARSNSTAAGSKRASASP
jgi:cytochrome P450